MSRAVAPPGRRVRCPGDYTAHVPDSLPPELVWTPDLIRALSDADRMIGRLAGEGARLPNPHVFIRPFIRREAVLSSRIEGTEATLGELLAAEAGVAVERSPADLREVGNYVTALEYGLKRLGKLPLSLRLMRELHEKLMTGVRGDRAAPGEFRKTQVWIGRPGSSLANATYGLLTRWRAQVAGSASGVAVRLLDLLAENPYCMVGRVADRLEVAFTTAQRAAEKLEARSIVRQVNRAKRDRVY